MSDDDRMDRAERIRRMREGDRTDEQSDEDDEPAADASASDGEAAEDRTDQSDPTDQGDQPTATTGSGSGTAGDGGETDPEAVAQRAAEAAAAVSGDAGEATAEVPDGEVRATAQPMQGPTGVDLPDEQLLEQAMDEGGATTTAGGARAAAVDEEATTREQLARVLEFTLGEEFYCLDIEYVEEIVKRESVTRVPNTPDYVEGVVDLRGQITTILEPKAMMDIDAEGGQQLVVVFDPDRFEDQGAIGWVVDEVRQVAPVYEDQLNEPPVNDDYVNGVVDRDDEDQFVIWIQPDRALDVATTGEDD